jgi:hypothetical protein
MPASEFETALLERVEFSAYVAYEQWAQRVGYAAHNPYDVLARILPGLALSLSNAVAERGGWSAFEPGALNPSASRILIAEMISQVVAARVSAAAPDAPDGPLLARVLVDAVGGAVSVFVDDPESWRLAQAPQERAAIVSLGERSLPFAPLDLPADPQPLAPVLEAGEVATTEAGSVVAAIERLVAPDRALNLFEGEFLFARTGGSSNIFRVNLGGTVITSDTSVAFDLIVESSGSTNPFEQIVQELLEFQIAPAVEPVPAPAPGIDPAVETFEPSPSWLPEAFEDLPSEVVQRVTKLLTEATYYYANRPLQPLSAPEVAAILPAVFEAFLVWVAERAQLGTPGTVISAPAPAMPDATVGSTPVVAFGPSLPPGTPPDPDLPTPLPPPPDPTPESRLVAAINDLTDTLNLPPATTGPVMEQSDLVVVVAPSDDGSGRIDGAVAIGAPGSGEPLPVGVIVQNLTELPTGPDQIFPGG